MCRKRGSRLPWGGEVEAAKAVAADGKQDVEVGKEGEEQGLNPKRSRKRKNHSSDSKPEHTRRVFLSLL
jgi:hypothetical protein